MHSTPDQSLPDLRPGIRPPGRRTFQFWAQGVLVAIIVGLTLYTLGRFRVALLWSAVLGVTCWPLMIWLQRRWTSRHSATLIPASIVAAIGLAFVVPAGFLIGAAASEAKDGSAWVKQIMADGVPQPAWLDRLPWGKAQAESWWASNLAQPDSARELVRHLRTEQSLGAIEHLGHDVANRLVLLTFTLLILFFLLRSGARLTNGLDLLIWRLFGPRGRMAQRQIVGAVRGSMAGLVLVGLGEGLVIGLSYVVAGAPQPLLLGIFTALASMIPMLGSVAVALSVALILIKGSVVAAACVAVFGGVVLFLADHFIRPVLIGGSIRLPFVWVLLGILGGLETWGLIGLFAGPTLMALAHLCWRFGSTRANREGRAVNA
ncbi:permease [Acetobacter nitrogenifigens DSM 23921 = NBRC 105050]|uniref:AI-2E family transporter n=1 Tax=Acetobacter nitrogenifigens DSM 23921 = NBRC 105050 TaxID=1120919 RepID=A0A511X957_9PROT|nr:AI-2E family transporter [Acetobacter nitrogenifigens]GBQ86951.1 permease [Acetobacter nitrogenifigens DSM 23921 = NBRC 105050]GEN59477.1 AI-2E family transporter [Acetobacter nitrogenifigens DSM 23921 = NBRC 105050]